MHRKLARKGVIRLGLLVIASFLARDGLVSTCVYGAPYPDKELQKLRQELETARRDFRTVRKSEVPDTEL